MWLTSAQLAKMRADVIATLPDEVALYRRDETVDDAGNVIPTMTLVSQIPCRLDPMRQPSGSNQVEGGQELLKRQYQLTLPYDAELAKNWQAVIDGKTYEVVDLHPDHSWNVSVRAVVVYVQ